MTIKIPITISSFKWFKVGSLFLLIISMTSSMQGQTTPIYYVGDHGETHFSLTTYTLDTHLVETITSRTPVVYGTISFGPGATWHLASNSHYIDGYAKTYDTNAFVFPIGQSGIYAPAQVEATTAAGVSAAYFRQNPLTVGEQVAPTVAVLSDLEYWKLDGATANPKITLSWRESSNVATLTNNLLSKLTIVGWNGIEWQAIASLTDYVSIEGDVSTLNLGSISTINTVDLSVYSVFSLAQRGDICLPYIASSDIVKTWDNGWTPSAPTLNDPAVILSAFSGDLVCNSLILNANITLVGTQSVEIVNGVSGSGVIIMSSEASVVQHNAASTAPKIEMTKVTRPMRRYDYVFLSSPITNAATFYDNLTSGATVAVEGNFGSQPLSGFSNFKTLNATGQQVTVTNFTVGKGYRALVRNQAPFSTTSTWITEKKSLHIKTIGVANNGTISVDLPANNWAFMGNPYPSAIDSQLLLEAGGSNLGSTLYYWTYNSPMSNLFTYAINDWATWTSAGGTAVCLTCEKPNGSISSMQSVYVKSISANATTFNFTNCMRKTQGNSNFYRTATHNRYWVNMMGSNGSFNQILLAYSEDSTLDDDASDGLKMTGTESSLSSYRNNFKYAIQGRGVFDAADVIPLSIDKANGEQFTIAMGEKEGIFEGNATPVYLHDSVLGVYHDLALGAYSFIQNTTNDVTRFSIVYANGQLNNWEHNSIQAVAIINNATVSVSASLVITNLTIYDLVGREIVTYSNQNSTSLHRPFHHVQGIYIAKITLENGAIVSQKLFNK